jgi:hypothetical protein
MTTDAGGEEHDENDEGPTNANGAIKDGPLLLSGQKRKHGHPLADGYDISSMIAIEAGAVRSGEGEDDGRRRHRRMIRG